MCRTNLRGGVQDDEGARGLVAITYGFVVAKGRVANREVVHAATSKEYRVSSRTESGFPLSRVLGPLAICLHQAET